jgi:hypothetical protein
MMIHHSLKILEQLTAIEEEIKHWEKIISELGITCDQEGLLKELLAKKYHVPSGQNH